MIEDPTDEEFDSSKWRAEKYGQRELIFLSQEEYSERLRKIKLVINKTLIQAEKEFKRDWNSSYDIVGVLIFGAWARGEVHTGSDLDIYTLSKQDPVDLSWDFENRLKRNKIGVEIDQMRVIITTDLQEVQRFVEGSFGMAGKDFLVVTPYPDVKELFERK